ncbi:sulfotransferase family protein [Alteromonas lipotrueae]|uniref:sulfotransferase family protein n=1 Tax=Alteromonas lipotrueae TaxID=2803814 RepID=UPI001C4390C2|nr:sulfotransferase [Alteromonas lipotrueae]
MSETTSVEPIFIVGVPRSGTTLLTSYLVSHQDIMSGPETQFFNKIGEDAGALGAALEEDNWPELAYDLMSSSLKLSNVNVLDLYQKSREDILSFLSSRKPSLGAMLESIVLPASDNSSSKRWLEKTPNHINHLDDIKTQYPSAKIILIHRDPRDSAASIAKLPWAPKSTIANALLVESWLSNTYSGFKNEKNCHIVSYERLILNTEIELKKVFSFLGEKYSPSILERKSAGDVTTEAEPWKKDVHQAIDTKHLALWKKRVPPPVLTQIESIMSACLSFYSYKQPVNNLTQKAQLIRVRKQDFVGLDDFAAVINKHKICLSNEQVNVSLFYVERGYKLAIIRKALKLKLFKKKKIIFVGQKLAFSKLLGDYLK